MNRQGTEEPEETCPCGRPLHYATPDLRRSMDKIVRECGRMLVVKTSAGSWEVPRHFIALHGIKSEEMPALAAQYKFKKLR